MTKKNDTHEWKRMVRFDKNGSPHFPIDDKDPKIAARARDAMKSYQKDNTHAEDTLFAMNFGSTFLC
jgi:hypothetical protein